MKSRKSRNTWSNRQIWPWNGEWSRAKTNRVLPRKCTGHSKHPVPTTQEKTLHMDITRWSTLKSDWLYSLQSKMKKLYTVSISPCNEYSGLVSFMIYWFDLLAVQGTLGNLLQCHSLKALILWLSTFFTVRLSQLYVTTGKTIALTVGNFVDSVMSLIFNTLCRFVIAFLPRSKRFLFRGCSHNSQWF